MTPLRTALHAVHVELGAKIVDFAGWEMPLHYGSQLDEHHRVRRSAGMFDVSHMLAVDVRGKGAHEYLRRLLANDVARLEKAGQALYSCMLNEEAGVLDDLIVYARAEGTFRLIVNAGTAGKDLEWLERQLRSTSAVELTPRRDLAIIAVQGPEARAKLWDAWPAARVATQSLARFASAELEQSMVARTGYTGEDGFEVMTPAENAVALWRALAAVGVAPAGLGARDTLRLEAGMPLYGQDMDEHVTPRECGLGWTIDLGSARDFVGRKALEARAPRYTRIGLVLEERGVMRQHQRVRTGGGEGEITSGGFSPTMNRSIALARVAPGAAASPHAQIEVRGKWLRARAVEPPFVRNGKVMVTT